MAATLCIYYSRTGTTRSVVHQAAKLLHAEIVALHDGVHRQGIIGYLRSGMDAMRKTPPSVEAFQTKLPLTEYDHIIIATPVWAGRCSSVIHAFLHDYGHALPARISFILTHLSEKPYDRVCSQMDAYLSHPHSFVLTLCPNAPDRHHRIYAFIRAIEGDADDSHSMEE